MFPSNCLGHFCGGTFCLYLCCWLLSFVIFPNTRAIIFRTMFLIAQSSLAPIITINVCSGICTLWHGRNYFRTLAGWSATCPIFFLISRAQCDLHECISLPQLIACELSDQHFLYPLNVCSSLTFLTFPLSIQGINSLWGIILLSRLCAEE